MPGPRRGALGGRAARIASGPHDTTGGPYAAAVDGGSLELDAGLLAATAAGQHGGRYEEVSRET